MNTAVVLMIERSTRDELAELKGDSTYNTAILILLKRNRILKLMLEKSDNRERMRRYYKELFEDEIFLPLVLV